MISSRSNSQVKYIEQLKNKSKIRERDDVFLVEGLKMFREIPKNRLCRAYVSESFLDDAKKSGILSGIPYEVVLDRVFAQMSDTKTPQGILAVVRQFHYTEEEILDGRKKLILLIENLQDPGNLGTIIRTGEGAGITGIVMNRATVDIYNPKVIRSTMGAVFRVPFLYTDSLEKMAEKMKKKNITIYAAHLGGREYYDEEDYREDVAFMIGNEGNGLTEEVAKKADRYIKIPMEGRVESLNAAVAASILMYEAYRQRR
jgi:TrmH family RNA methyltransferase